MLRKRKVFLAYFVSMSCVLIAFQSLPDAQVDPFYKNLLGKAEKAFLAKNYAEAARDFEIAAFGLVQHRSLQAKAYVYLGLSHYFLKDIRKSEKFIRQASELLEDKDFASLGIVASALPELEKLLMFLNIRADLPPQPAETPPLQEKQAQENPAQAVKEPDKKAPDNPGQTKPLSLDQIKEGDLVPTDIVEIMPTVTRRVSPVYPSAARSQRIEGTVMVNALVSETGAVIKTEIIKGMSGVYGFNHAAEQAVRSWKFEPATIKGLKVKVWVPILLHFKSQEPSS